MGSRGALCLGSLGRMAGLSTGWGFPGVRHAMTALGVQLELVWARGLGISGAAIAGWLKHLDPASIHVIKVKREYKK